MNLICCLFIPFSKRYNFLIWHFCSNNLFHIRYCDIYAHTVTPYFGNRLANRTWAELLICLRTEITFKFKIEWKTTQLFYWMKTMAYEYWRRQGKHSRRMGEGLTTQNFGVRTQKNIRKFCVKFAYYRQGFSFLFKICVFCVNFAFLRTFCVFCVHFAFFAYILRFFRKICVLLVKKMRIFQKVFEDFWVVGTSRTLRKLCVFWVNFCVFCVNFREFRVKFA